MMNLSKNREFILSCINNLSQKKAQLVAKVSVKIYKLWRSPIVGFALWPLALIVQFGALLRRALLKPRSLKPVTIVVGNLNVGGSGKTPFVVWLVKKLEQQRLTVGVVTRGYKGFFRLRKPYVAYRSYNPLWLGDEGALIGEHCRCPVAAYFDRYLAAQQLIQEHRVDVIIFDDGLQYPGLVYDVKICLYNPQQAGNGFTLPAGPLRAPLETLEGCDFVLNAQAQQAPFIKKNRPWVQHNQRKEERLLSSFQFCSLVIGLADPEPVVSFVKSYVPTVKTIILGDHEPCSIFQLKNLLLEGPVVMTEKDWVKLKNELSGDEDLWILPLTLEVCPIIEEHIISTVQQRHHHAILQRLFF